MAVMLDPHSATDLTRDDQSAPKENATPDGAESQGDSKEPANLLNLNCTYDFRPTNFNFLMLSRFSFATKRKRI